MYEFGESSDPPEEHGSAAEPGPRQAGEVRLAWTTVIVVSQVFLLLVAVQLLEGDWGVTATLGIPLGIGFVGGAASSSPRGCAQALIVTMLIAGGCSLVFGLAGVFCVLLAFCVFLVPTVIGMLSGMFLRSRLELSRKARCLLLLLPALVVPVHAIEWAWFRAPSPSVSHRTAVVLDATPEQVWRALRFYDELDHEPPLALRLGFPSPVSTTGVLGNVGDEQECVYDKGIVWKRLVEVEPARIVRFEVTRQEIGFERSVRLTHGAFRLRPYSGGRTILTLETEYLARLTPRWIWRPVEAWALRDLHLYLIEGVELELDRTRRSMSIVSSGMAGERDVSDILLARPGAVSGEPVFSTRTGATHPKVGRGTLRRSGTP